MPQLNKRGQITIPADIRSTLKAFAGMKFEARVSDNKITLTPYNYECADCGAKIPEGSSSSFCEKCRKKRRIRVY